MNKKRGLGKGLSALIPTVNNENDVKSDGLLEIKLNRIIANPNQPRQRMDEGNLKELVDSIKTHGLIQPIIVRTGKGGNFEIIAGERRWLACKRLKMESVPAIVKNYNDLEASAAALIENIQREDLNTLEEAGAYQKLMESHGLTQEELSNRLGKSRSFIANMVRLLALPPDIKEYLRAGKLTAGHARALLPITEDEVKVKFAARIIDKQLNVRETEKIVRQYLEGKKENRTHKDKKTLVEKKDWERNLTNRLGRKTNIKQKPDGSGTLVIKFSNREDLITLIDKIKIN